jgi:VanZ family protein
MWLATIIIVSSLPNIPTLRIHAFRGELRLDYLIHICEYGLLATLMYLSVAGPSFRISSGKFITVTFSLVIFAIADEFHQKFIPGRFFSYVDLASNLTGIALAGIISFILFRKIESLTPGHDQIK